MNVTMFDAMCCFGHTPASGGRLALRKYHHIGSYPTAEEALEACRSHECQHGIQETFVMDSRNRVVGNPEEGLTGRGIRERSTREI